MPRDSAWDFWQVSNMDNEESTFFVLYSNEKILWNGINGRYLESPNEYPCRANLSDL
jgi:hypothetical protein